MPVSQKIHEDIVQALPKEVVPDPKLLPFAAFAALPLSLSAVTVAVPEFLGCVVSDSRTLRGPKKPSAQIVEAK